MPILEKALYFPNKAALRLSKLEQVNEFLNRLLASHELEMHFWLLKMNLQNQNKQFSNLHHAQLFELHHAQILFLAFAMTQSKKRLEQFFYSSQGNNFVPHLRILR